jgi:hypothetical protein
MEVEIYIFTLLEDIYPSNGKVYTGIEHSVYFTRKLSSYTLSNGGNGVD